MKEKNIQFQTWRKMAMLLIALWYTRDHWRLSRPWEKDIIWNTRISTDSSKCTTILKYLKKDTNLEEEILKFVYLLIIATLKLYLRYATVSPIKDQESRCILRRNEIRKVMAFFLRMRTLFVKYSGEPQLVWLGLNFVGRILLVSLSPTNNNVTALITQTVN